MTNNIELLDDASRPTAPKIEGVTAAQRQHGKRLSLFHKYHLQEMADVRAALDNFLGTRESAERTSETIASLSMIDNYRLFGNLCGHECRALTLHHTVEDRSIFPLMRNHTPGLDKVIDRLSAEHQIVHKLLVKLQEAAKNIALDPSEENFLELQETFRVLEQVVTSHFGYEERELEEALGYYNAPF